MPNLDYSALVAKQREFFLSGATRPVAWRKAQLEALKRRCSPKITTSCATRSGKTCAEMSLTLT